MIRNRSSKNLMCLPAIILLGVLIGFGTFGCSKDTTENEVKKTASPASKPKFANTRCPIMGSPINPDQVPANLIREYKGQKVAFCCGMCPPQWDKLSDEEKQAKLRKAQE